MEPAVEPWGCRSWTAPAPTGGEDCQRCATGEPKASALSSSLVLPSFVTCRDMLWTARGVESLPRLRPWCPSSRRRSCVPKARDVHEEAGRECRKVRRFFPVAYLLADCFQPDCCRHYRDHRRARKNSVTCPGWQSCGLGFFQPRSSGRPQLVLTQPSLILKILVSGHVERVCSHIHKSACLSMYVHTNTQWRLKLSFIADYETTFILPPRKELFCYVKCISKLSAKTCVLCNNRNTVGTNRALIFNEW